MPQGEYNGKIEFAYQLNDGEMLDLLKNPSKLTLDFKVKYVKGNTSSSGNAQPEAVQIDVTETGIVNDSTESDDDTRLYAVLRNNGKDKKRLKLQ